MNRRTHRRTHRPPPGALPAALLTAALLAAALLTGCGIQATPEDDTDGLGDAPVGTVHQGPADVITFPDGVGNIFSKCDGAGHRVYSTVKGIEASSITVIADPTCPGGEPR